ncbi:hypothetical protein IFT48_05040 [Pseudomonas fluorescens]|uniref:hypothetical protein n=2 Tax=Pseudomonas TaxID=286 RepID=UPI001930D720|nr:hypothetical protein [Pseudomonas fluorescens]MBD8089341.1 hypothetical protein [Pseudomonas fluorescens]
MTDDMRRIINILVDWMMIQGSGPKDLLQVAAVRKLLQGNDDHSLRMKLALSLSFGLDPDEVLIWIQTDQGEARLDELLVRCRKAFMNS